MKFNRKSQVKSKIPTASLPDIIFMLLFFFMVTTVLRLYEGLMVDLPDSVSIEKIESRRHTSYLWINREGRMSFDDVIVKPEDHSLYTKAFTRRMQDPQITMSLKYDKSVPMGLISLANDELRKANALIVNFATGFKAR